MAILSLRYPSNEAISLCTHPRTLRNVAQSPRYYLKTVDILSIYLSNYIHSA